LIGYLGDFIVQKNVVKRGAGEPESDDGAYLEQIARLSFDRKNWTKKELLDVLYFLGPWSHNIRLPHGVRTAFCDDYYPAHREMMAVVNERLGGNFKGKRVIDIGCLEGYFAVECALQGADVTGVDGKVINVKKCEFVKSVLGVGNLEFVLDDAMNVTRRKYGGFDVVLALGLLYHLSDPFRFLKNVAGLCEGFVLIDTHVALAGRPGVIKGDWKPTLTPLKEFRFAGKTYTGRLYREFADRTSRVAKELSPTASLRDDWAVWLTEDSLVSLLRDVGFEEVSKVVFPGSEGAWWSDVRKDARVLLVAVRKRRPWASRVFPAAAGRERAARVPSR
jgi:2-polyprenyl-3-methyl-5-hydroxy-6-metoxy-1,4-benzoquinol methylase